MLFPGKKYVDTGNGLDYSNTVISDESVRI